MAARSATSLSADCAESSHQVGFRAVKDRNGGNFGLLIAYVLPGMTAIWGLSYVSETVQGWLGSSTEAVPTIGGFLYVTLAAVGAGLVASTVRWMVVDIRVVLHGRWGSGLSNGRLARRRQSAVGRTGKPQCSTCRGFPLVSRI
jgi:hypothetical protein